MPSHASHDFPPAPGVSAVGTPGGVRETPAHRVREFAAHGIGRGLAPLPGLPGLPLGAAPSALGAAGVRPDTGPER
jgi:hypothetical protein